MEAGKRVSLVVVLGLLITFLSCYIFIFLYGNEERVTEDPMSDLYSQYNAIINASILFETNDYVVMKKIRRYGQIFTQGFFMDTNETVIESGGHYKESLLQRYNILTPDKPMAMFTVPDDYFAEGCTLFNGKIYQLTWREKIM
jgi:glutamine cyclotransferase